MSNKARMRPDTIAACLRRTAQQLEREAREYIDAGKDAKPGSVNERKYGRRAGHLFAAARELREIAGYHQ